MSSRNIPVMFRGRKYIWVMDGDGETACGPLAPPDQCDDDNELRLEAALFGDSYAHVYADGTIMRYGVKIGMRGDLEPVDSAVRHDPRGSKS